MPRLKLTKTSIDLLSTPSSDVIYWDAAFPGFGVKVTPKGRKVFVVLYRTGGAGSKLRKYTIGPYGRVTLHQARVAAQKVFAAQLEGLRTRVRGPFVFTVLGSKPFREFSRPNDAAGSSQTSWRAFLG